ncbi:TfoX/Sxy family DNA transformation protein [Vibrio barjaei]|uniref:TfoX/Sxy family DNA transformation protein n=1 Tax=Vibrio barjaei TaxID=1676683 RepID=UPI002284E74C|nr:TfoX/Sxy family DNA transformation protein [Vibrio barjaei]MCY9873810.1 TfoX/Sxy family DNA transformation protein [Vibrio barjaei]
MARIDNHENVEKWLDYFFDIFPVEWRHHHSTKYYCIFSEHGMIGKIDRTNGKFYITLDTKLFKRYGSSTGESHPLNVDQKPNNHYLIDLEFGCNEMTELLLALYEEPREVYRYVPKSHIKKIRDLPNMNAMMERNMNKGGLNTIDEFLALTAEQVMARTYRFFNYSHYQNVACKIEGALVGINAFLVNADRREELKAFTDELPRSPGIRCERVKNAIG